MIKKLFIYESTGFDPYLNIATEKYLMDQLEADSCILYLWQNQNTVVIGRNQNAWAECRTGLLEEEGGKLARRLSGGGAVFHDLGNLNFTFIASEADYDVDRQLSVIQAACDRVGIQAERSGRNDLLVSGFKFSGNAFFHRKGRAYHHGTLLVNADMDKLSRYLTPPKAKLAAKGIQSVRSRVTNLQAFCPTLTCEMLKQHMKAAFGQIYGMTPKALTLDPKALAQISQAAGELGSWQWLYGQKHPFSAFCEDKFPWGYLRLELQVEAGTITTLGINTDSMDWQLGEKLTAALTGCKFKVENMQDAIRIAVDNADICDDLCNMIQNQNI